MEKEMKKLLLVAVSVGIFLLVTITVAIIILTPKTQNDEITVSSSIPYSHGRPQTPDIMNNMPPEPVIINNTQEVTTIVNNDFPETSVTTTIDQSGSDRVTIQIPRPQGAAIPDSTDETATVSRLPSTHTPATAPSETSAANGTSVTTTPSALPAASSVTTQTAPTTTPAATSAGAERNAAAATTPAAETQSGARGTATTAAPSNRSATSTSTTSTSTTRSTSRQTTTTRTGTTRAINDYWVQIGAFSSMVRAEDAKDLLSSNGLTSIIDTRVVNGQNFYRVRLGPYTSENEAKQWLEIVKIIEGFQNSQVRQTTRSL